MPRSLSTATRSVGGSPLLLSRERIASQAWATTEHTLAVEMEPPDTGAGGSRVSPSSTVTFS